MPSEIIYLKSASTSKLDLNHILVREMLHLSISLLPFTE